MSDNKKQFDICIVGAGMAGATIAAYLAPRGINIALIDKSFTEKKRIVGELLQPGAIQSLEKMGLTDLLQGFDAQPVYGYALFKDSEHFAIPYNDDGSTKYHGYGLQNGRFLQKIRANALQNATVTQIEGAVTELCEDDDKVIIGVKYKEKRSGEVKRIDARLTITSDGFFSSLRKHLASTEKSVTSYFIGFILKDCQLPYPNYGHVFLSGPTPFICYPISSNEVRVLIDYPGDKQPRKSDIGPYLEKNVAPYIPEGMKEYYDNALQQNQLKVMPNHYLAAKPILKKGAVLLGDALNMRHPLTGGGITAVFSDVYLLSTYLLSMPDFSDLNLMHKKVERYYKDRQYANANVNILANALYGVMSNDLLKTAVFKYIQKGDANAHVPISILAGLNRDHKALIKHFFSVAYFGASDLLRQNIFNLPKACKVLLDAVKIIRPLARNELSWASVFKK